MNIQSALAQLFEGQDLSQQQTREVFLEVMSGNTTPAQIGALLAALRVKGETIAEIAGAVAIDVRLIGIEGARTIVATVPDPVVIDVRLIGVR